MTKLVKTLAMSLALASTVSFATHAAAQQSQDAQQSASAPMTQSKNFDDATLEKFTVAMNAVSQVANKYQSEMTGDESPEKMQEIQQTAQKEMVSEIQDAGLEVQTYTTIAQLVQTDEQLRERVLEIVNAQKEQDS